MKKTKTRGKKYLEAKEKIHQKTVYTPQEAINLAKQTSITRFDATIELHARLGIDTKKGEQQVRGTIVLPFAKGNSKRVAAFVGDAKVKEAESAGADLIGNDALIEEMSKTQKIDFDVAVATPDMMPKLAKIAKILGPKGLMPNPKTDTVGVDIARIITELKKGKLSYKNDDTANVHLPIGKVSQDEKELLQNFQAALAAIKKVKPHTSKGVYLKSAFLATTMGPSIKVSTA